MCFIITYRVLDRCDGVITGSHYRFTPSLCLMWVISRGRGGPLDGAQVWPPLRVKTKELFHLSSSSSTGASPRDGQLSQFGLHVASRITMKMLHLSSIAHPFATLLLSWMRPGNLCFFVYADHFNRPLGARVAHPVEDWIFSVDIGHMPMKTYAFGPEKKCPHNISKR